MRKRRLRLLLRIRPATSSCTSEVTIQMVMKEQFVCIHVVEEGRPKEVHLSVDDHRFNQPFAVFNKSENQTGIFQKLLLTQVGEDEVAFAAPNEIALALGTARNAFTRVKNKRQEIQTLAKDKGTIHGKDASIFYDALEDLQICIIFNYKAVESLCNALIPDDYVHEIEDSKGIIQRYRKEQIERWVSTSTKVKDILPAIMNCPKPTEQPFWGDFKLLEKLRNDLVHSKSKSSPQVLSELFSDKVARYARSISDLIEFFYTHSKKRQNFPVSFGDMHLTVLEIDNFEDLFEQID